MTATRTWKAAQVQVFCGYCHGLVKKGDQFLEIQLNGVKKLRIRCPKCAGDPIPGEVTPAAPTVLSFSRFGR